MLTLLAATTPPGQKKTKPAPQPVPPQGPRFWEMARHSVDLLLAPVPQTDPLRLAQLRQTFLDLECRPPHLREQPAPGGKNLLCTLPGIASGRDPSAGMILVLAQYRHQGPGQSAADNWSGAITLPFLYHALTFIPRKHTYVFAEVDGETGANALFDSLTPAQRGVIRGVIALDALGMGPLQYYINPNDSSGFLDQMFLASQLRKAAADQRVNAPVAAIPGSWLKEDVTREFRHGEIPSILLQSVPWSTRDLPGSARDTADAIDHNAYMANLMLLDYYIVELDGPWPSLNPALPSLFSHHRR